MDQMQTNLTAAAGVAPGVNSRPWRKEGDAPIVYNPLALAAHIRGQYDSFARNRTEITERIRAAKLALDRKYAPDTLESIRKFVGGSEKYYPLIRTKTKAGKAWLQKILASTDRPWSIEPTADPDISEEVAGAIADEAMSFFMSMSSSGFQPSANDAYEFATDMRETYAEYVTDSATRSAEQMTKQIQDVMDDGEFGSAFDEFLSDIVAYPAAFLRAAWIQDSKRRVTKLPDDQGGALVVEVKAEPKLKFSRINPIQVFPQPGAKSVRDGDLAVIDLKSLREITALASTPGYAKAQIEELLNDKQRIATAADTDVLDAFPEAKLYSADIYKHPSDIVAIEYWGTVSGQMLEEWGVQGRAEFAGMKEGETVEGTRFYDIHAILCEDYVIFCEVLAPGESRMIYSASYTRNIDSLWGDSVADLLSSSQKTLNALSRTMANNLALSAYPQAAMNIDALQVDKNDQIKIEPGKVWKYTAGNYLGSIKPIEFFTIPTRQSELAAEIQRELNDSERFSGIPEYAQGQPGGAVQGAAGTATGLLTLMDAASNQIKDPLNNIDKTMIEPLVSDLYYMLMSDPDIPADCKGDFRIKARGAVGLAVKEQQQIRRREFLTMILNSELLQQVIKPEGVIKLIREIIVSLDLPVNQILPTITEQNIRKAEQEVAQAQQQQMQQQAGGQQMPVQGGQSPQQQPQVPPQVIKALKEIDKQVQSGALTQEQGQYAAKALIGEMQGQGTMPQNDQAVQQPAEVVQ